MAEPDYVSALRGGLTWEKLADGRIHRLKRGKHYLGDPRTVIKHAGAAADAMGKAVRGVRDEFGKYEHVWVQFAEASIPVGAPCPICGSVRIVRKHEYFGACAQCGSRLILSGAIADDAEPGPGINRAPGRDLGHYEDVQLRFFDALEDRERWVGWGLLPGLPVLLLVEYPYGPEGHRIPDAHDPDQYLHKVRGMPLSPFADAIDLDKLVPPGELGGASAPPGDA